MAKKKSKTSPTQRSLAMYRAMDYQCWVVEHWNPHTKQRLDLFNFIDILAISDTETLGIQATSTGNMSARVSKILENPYAPLWLAEASRRIIVIGWRRYAKAKDRKLWRPTLKEVTLADFN